MKSSFKQQIHDNGNTFGNKYCCCNEGSLYKKVVVYLQGARLDITLCLLKYTENFTTKKWNFSDKNFDIFHISAQNIACGYSLELPQQGGSNDYPQSMFLIRN